MMLPSLCVSLPARACRWLLGLVACIALLAPQARAAGDACAPSAPLGTGAALLLTPQGTAYPVWLQARVMRAVTANVPASRLQLSAGQSLVLDHDEILRQAPLSLGSVDEASAVLRVEADAGTLHLRSADGKRNYRAAVFRQTVQDAGGNALQVAPSVTGDAPYRILKGSTVRADANGQLVIEPGALLRWEPEPAQPLTLLLTKPARLLLSAPPSSGAVVTLESARAPSNARLRMHVSVPDLDLRAHTPTLCLSASGVQRALPLQLVKQEGGGDYVFETRLDTQVVKALTAGASWWQRGVGIPAQARVMAHVDDLPVFDQTLPLTLSSVHWSALWGVLALVLVYLLAALAWRLVNPLRLVLMSIRDDLKQRSSLSNLQFLLWTLVVIFALVFNLSATDQLMALSTSVLGLLGIAGGASVMARGIDKKNAGGDALAQAAAPAPDAALKAPDAPAKADIQPQLAPLMQKADGQFDVLRFQMLAFTLFTLGYAVYSVLRSDGLPELPDSLYWLMGLSNLTYVGGKAAEAIGTGNAAAPAASAAPATDRSALESSLDANRIKAVQRTVGVAETGVLDAATRLGIEGYKRRHALYPADGRVLGALLTHMNV